MSCKICGKPTKTKEAKRCKPCYQMIVMAQRNKDTAPQRMRENNPMSDLNTRQKMKDTLRRIGHKPKVRGGNGTGLVNSQKILSNALNWKTEFAVATKMPRDSGYPTCYKLDLAHPELKIGIEIDGNSHRLLDRKCQDLIKVKFLKSMGWTILRYSNKQICLQLSKCLDEIQSYVS